MALAELFMRPFCKSYSQPLVSSRCLKNPFLNNLFISCLHLLSTSDGYSGCVTSAEAVLVEEQGLPELYRQLATDKTLVVCSFYQPTSYTRLH